VSAALVALPVIESMILLGQNIARKVSHTSSELSAGFKKISLFFNT
jgi:hypothetical protein